MATGPGKPKNNSSAFEVNVEGLREVIGGASEWRHVLELVANVFDEYNGYDEGKPPPTFCEVTFTKEGNNSAILTVTDDGSGFENVSDIWTFFRSTEKRNSSDVSGRFNVGEKQLLALAKEATVITNEHDVHFMDGSRKYTRHQKSQINGTKITAKLAWKFEQFNKAVEQLESVIAPEGLIYTVNGKRIENGSNKITTVNIPLPTVKLSNVDGMVALRNTTRKTDVAIYALDENQEAWLYELGFPICELGHEFTYSLDVRQKVPVGMSRDMVSKSYIERLMGLVIQAAPTIINESDEGSDFIKPAMEYIENPDAMKVVLDTLHSAKVTSWSSNTNANSMAASKGYNVLRKNAIGKKAMQVIRQNGLVKSSHEEFGEKVEKLQQRKAEEQIQCPNCEHVFNIQNAKEDASLLFGLLGS